VPHIIASIALVPYFRDIEVGQALLVDVVLGQSILPAGCRIRDVPVVVPMRD
jgi:hypothetical protein